MAGTTARKNLQDLKASLQRNTTPQIDWYESSQEVLAVKHRGELVEHASRYITTARKNLHDASTDLRGRHCRSSQSEPSIALRCLPVWSGENKNLHDVIVKASPQSEPSIALQCP